MPPAGESVYVANIGTRTRGANLARDARADNAPLATGRARASMVATKSIATNVSLELESRAKAV